MLRSERREIYRDERQVYIRQTPEPPCPGMREDIRT